MKSLPKFLTVVVTVATLSSCVSKKKYDEAMARAATEKSNLESELASAQEEKSQLQEQSNKLQKDLNMSQEEIAELGETVKMNNQKIKGLQDAIVEVFSTYDPNEISVSEREGKLYITLANSILFDSGRDKLNKESKEVIAKMADVLKSNGGLEILVEGHTDSEPVKIHRGKYTDNWGLSTARALSIVREMEKMGVNGDRLTATGKGDTQPIASNDSKEGRVKNRRTEFVIEPKIDGLYRLYKEEMANSGSNSGSK